MRNIVCRCAQSLPVIGKETPKSVVGRRGTGFDRVGRHRCRQWILGRSQLEFGTRSMDRRHTAGFVQIAFSVGSGGRKV